MEDNAVNISETRAIYGFAQKTRSGEMIWEKKAPPASEFINSEITERYATEYNKESMELSVESRMDTTDDVDYYREAIHLWILDENGQRLWRFPDNDALGDLLSTIRFQTGKVADRLRRLLKS